MYSDILARQNDLLVLAFPVHGCHSPVGDYDRDTKHDDEEDIGLETAAVDDGENALDDKGHAEDEDGEVCVGKVAVSLCETHEGRVLDGRRRVQVRVKDPGQSLYMLYPDFSILGGLYPQGFWA